MFPQKAECKLNKAIQENTIRNLKTYPNGIDFFSNDYLGLGRIAHLNHNNVEHRGNNGSRLISGNTEIHINTENYLSHFYQSEASLLYNSGYLANLGLLGCVPQKGDTILYDSLCHTSIREGIRLSFSKSYSFKHNDLEDLQKKAAKSTGSIFVVTEGVFSMDGDCCPVNDLAKLCFENKWFLILDEAHSTGVLGSNSKGIFEESHYPIFARVHTFGKALGYHGAVICGSKKLITFLINFSRPFIYTTAMPAQQCEMIVNKHKQLLMASDGQTNLKLNIHYFNKEKKALKIDKFFLKSSTPIQGIVHSAEKLRQIETELNKKKILVKSIFSPTVPQGKERIRIILHSYNTHKEIQTLLETIQHHV